MILGSKRNLASDTHLDWSQQILKSTQIDKHAPPKEEDLCPHPLLISDAVSVGACLQKTRTTFYLFKTETYWRKLSSLNTRDGISRRLELGPPANPTRNKAT